MRGSYVVLYFYPKDDTPGCTTEATEFRDLQTRFSALDALIVGISPDSVSRHAGFKAKYDLTFVLAADEEKEVAKRYGVWRTKINYGRAYEGIVRSTFLIDPEGKIAHVWDNIKAKGHAERVLATLEKLRAA